MRGDQFTSSTASNAGRLTILRLMRSSSSEIAGARAPAIFMLLKLSRRTQLDRYESQSHESNRPVVDSVNVGGDASTGR